LLAETSRIARQLVADEAGRSMASESGAQANSRRPQQSAHCPPEYVAALDGATGPRSTAAVR